MTQARFVDRRVPSFHLWAFVLLGAALGVVGLSLYGEQGLWASVSLRKDLRLAQSRLKTLEAENQDLRRQIMQFRQDPFWVEKAAREELGFARPEEIVFRVVGD